MKLQHMAVTAVFTLTCFTVPVMRASAVGVVVDGKPAVGVETGAAGVRPDAGAVGRDNAGNANAPGAEVSEAARPDWSKGAMAEQVRDLQQQFKQQQKELMQKYRELLKASKDASKEERDKIRTEIREELRSKIEELMAKQKELRTELRQRFQEHRELVDAAREKAREKVRERRGNGE